ncbi:MAG TPA: hypothetical protein VIF09_09655 [Polyangiaceae bacterium]
MGETRKSPPPEAGHKESGDRPTLVPDFDPQAFARESEQRRRAAPAVEATAEEQCLAALGSLRAVLVLAVSSEELKGLPLDHVGGFLLSLLDGATDVETVLDICGLPRSLALRHLRELVERGIAAPGSSVRPR